MIGGLIMLAGAGFAFVAYVMVDQGGVKFGGAIIAMLLCFGLGASMTEKRPSYGVECRDYSIFASDC